MRSIFQPFEESAFTIFAKTSSSDKSKDSLCTFLVNHNENRVFHESVFTVLRKQESSDSCMRTGSASPAYERLHDVVVPALKLVTLIGSSKAHSPHLFTLSSH